MSTVTIIAIIIISFLFGAFLIVGILGGVLMLINEETKRVCRNCKNYDRQMGACYKYYKNVHSEFTCPNYNRGKWEE